MEQLKLCLLGGFRLSDGERVLDESAVHSNKMLRILIYLLVNRANAQPSQRLVSIFWQDDSKKDPEAALRNQMYRMRQELKKLGDRPYICTLQEAYQWNPEIPVETDYEAYERMAEQLQAAECAGQKEMLCREILDGYRGNVTAKVAGESWFLSRAVWYQEAYLEASRQLCEIRAKNADWNEVEKLSLAALVENPLDEELHCWELKSLYGRKKVEQAAAYYEKAARMFRDSLGLENPEKLKKVYEEQSQEQAMENITSVLQKIQAADKGSNKAYLCSFPIFCEICSLDRRRIARTKVAVHVMLITLRQTGRHRGPIPGRTYLKEEMEVLTDVIRDELREGDVAAQYGQTQVLLLLVACSSEGCVAVMERIQKEFRRRIGRRNLELLYELKELVPQKG